jgi:hypothetical protein
VRASYSCTEKDIRAKGHVCLATEASTTKTNCICL